MLDPKAIMRPFEEEGNTLIRGLKFRRYPRRIAALAEEGLQCNGSFGVTMIRRNLAPLLEFLKDFEGDLWYISAVASAYITSYREARSGLRHYRQEFGSASANSDLAGDLMPLTVLLPRRDPPSIWDMRRLANALRWLMKTHRPRLERAVGLTMLRGRMNWGVDYLATKTTPYLEKVLYGDDKHRWRDLILGSEYWLVERGLSSGNLRYSPDGEWVYMRHGLPHRRSWGRTYTYRELAVLAGRIAMWDAGWVLGRAVEMTEAEAYRMATALNGAEERRSGVDMMRYPWLFDEKGDYKPSPFRPERCRIAAAIAGR